MPSAENLNGWKSASERLQRWAELVARNDDDQVLFFLAMCDASAAMRDWLHLEGGVKPTEVDDAIRANTCASLARDVANRTKHYRLGKNPTDANWFICWEYLGDDMHEAVICGAGSKFSLQEFASQTLAFWKNAVVKLSPRAPSAPTAQPGL